jgi:hypothetical protein
MREVSTTKDAYESLDPKDQEFVDKLNKKKRKEVLREVSGEEEKRSAFGKNFFNRKKS